MPENVASQGFVRFLLPAGLLTGAAAGVLASMAAVAFSGGELSAAALLAAAGLAAAVSGAAGFWAAKRLEHTAAALHNALLEIAGADTLSPDARTMLANAGQRRSAFGRLACAVLKAADRQRELSEQASELEHANHTASQLLQESAGRLEYALQQTQQHSAMLSQSVAQAAHTASQHSPRAEQLTRTLHEALHTWASIQQTCTESAHAAAQMRQQAHQLAREAAAQAQQVAHVHPAAEGVDSEAARLMEQVRTGIAPQVHSALAAAQQAQQHSAVLEQSIQQMGEWSAQVGSISETIEDIASQTNLIALNAAIEAARAAAESTLLMDQLLDETMVTQAHLIAALLTLRADWPLDSFIELTQKFKLDNICITDADGVVTLSNEKRLIGLRFSDNPAEQTYEFRALLGRSDGVVCQRAQERTFDQRKFKYVGVSRIDQPGIVQVGFHNETMSRFGMQVGGFAVVANEIRKLAERTAQATRAIGQVIKTSQKNMAAVSKEAQRVQQELHLTAGSLHTLDEQTAGLQQTSDAIKAASAAIQAAMLPLKDSAAAMERTVQEMLQLAEPLEGRLGDAAQRAAALDMRAVVQTGADLQSGLAQMLDITSAIAGSEGAAV